MKTLRTITLLFGLTLALPTPTVKAAQPANNNVGWIIGGAIGLGVILWNIYGKAWAKKEKKNAKQACDVCSKRYRKSDLIRLHPNTTGYVRNAVPSVNHRAQQRLNREQEQMNRLRIAELPKCHEHMACPECTINIFKEAVTCSLHALDGSCRRCDSHGTCLYCPAPFADQACQCALDIGWVNRNNDLYGAINRVYGKNDTEERSYFTGLWDQMVREYPRMIRDLNHAKQGDIHAHQQITAQYYSNWTWA